jgi:TPR repeat protein
MRRALAIAALCLLVVLPARADFDDGMEAYDRGDYATALKEWRPLAEEGEADAQFAMGLLYAFGKGVTLTQAEAVRWYRLAAEQGHATAQYNLASMYFYGQGVA